MAFITNIQRFSVNDGPGIRTTVFLKGCPLRCKWCHNPETQAYEGADAREYSPREVFDICLRDEAFYINSGGGVTLSGGEPLTHPHFAKEFLTLCHDWGIHTALDTSGYAPFEVLESLLPVTDLFLYDIKHTDDAEHKLFTGVENTLIFKNLRALSERGGNIWARVPLIDGVNASEQNILALRDILSECCIKKVTLLPYHSYGVHKYKELGLEYEGEDFRAPSEGQMALYKRILEEFL